MLILATIACAEKYFVNIRVYAAIPGSYSEFYDKSANRILQDNVWVFRPDGTFSAIVIVDGERKLLSGKYGADNAGDDMYISIDTNDDGKYDDSLYVSKDSSFIEWRRNNGTLKYLLAS
jgi:hypothetical protein